MASRFTQLAHGLLYTSMLIYRTLWLAADHLEHGRIDSSEKQYTGLCLGFHARRPHSSPVNHLSILHAHPQSCSSAAAAAASTVGFCLSALFSGNYTSLGSVPFLSLNECVEAVNGDLQSNNTTPASQPAVRHCSRAGYIYDSTPIRRPFDCLLTSQ